MSNYKVTFKKQLAAGASGDRREYALIVEARSLGEAEMNAMQELKKHQKGFLSNEDIIKIEQVSL